MGISHVPDSVLIWGPVIFNFFGGTCLFEKLIIALDFFSKNIKIHKILCMILGISQNSVLQLSPVEETSSKEVE